MPSRQQTAQTPSDTRDGEARTREGLRFECESKAQSSFCPVHAHTTREGGKDCCAVSRKSVKSGTVGLRVVGCALLVSTWPLTFSDSITIELCAGIVTFYRPTVASAWTCDVATLIKSSIRSTRQESGTQRPPPQAPLFGWQWPRTARPSAGWRPAAGGIKNKQMKASKEVSHDTRLFQRDADLVDATQHERHEGRSEDGPQLELGEQSKGHETEPQQQEAGGVARVRRRDCCIERRVKRERINKVGAKNAAQ